MSEIADRTRDQRRRWAAPHGSHDRLVGFLGWVLPGAIGVLAAFLAIAPLTVRNEISFMLAKDKVDVAQERMRVTAASYRGADSKGQPFVLRAGSAVQATSREPVVQLRELDAQIQMTDGPAEIHADKGRYDMSAETVAIDGPILFTASDGYRLETSDAALDLKSRQITGTGAVEGRMPLGSFSAATMRADLAERVVTLEGRARVRIVQGGLD